MQIPRRAQIQEMTPTELQIMECIIAVEKLGADVRLTNCVVKLTEAKDHLSDWLDGFQSGPMTNRNFGEAVAAVKQGKLIAREGWNGKKMFVFMRPAVDSDPMFIIEKVESLPEAYKETLKNVTFTEGDKVHFGPYLCMKAADNSIVNGWLASQTDILAEDWCIF